MLATGPEAFYRDMISHHPRPASVVAGATDPETAMTQHALWPEQPTFDERMMFIDQISYLPDDILVKVDRAAMAISLETRVPMLDHRVVEFAWSLPLSLKRRQGVGKYLLRELLYRHVPRELIERPKAGFAVPVDEWLRGPLRDWAESLLSEPALTGHGLLRAEPIRRRWTEHLSGRRNWYAELWHVLMFQAWIQEQRGH